MKQCTTSTHLTRTIHRLEHILANEEYPAIRAAELAPQLPEAEQQVREMVTLYDKRELFRDRLCDNPAAYLC